MRFAQIVTLIYMADACFGLCDVCCCYVHTLEGELAAMVVLERIELAGDIAYPMSRGRRFVWQYVYSTSRWSTCEKLGRFPDARLAGNMRKWLGTAFALEHQLEDTK